MQNLQFARLLALSPPADSIWLCQLHASLDQRESFPEYSSVQYLIVIHKIEPWQHM